SYESDTPRPITFSSSDWIPFDLLAGGTVITFNAKPCGISGSSIFTAPAAATANDTVTLELSAAQTGTLLAKITYQFDLVAALANGDTVTLVQGDMTVLPSIG